MDSSASIEAIASFFSALSDRTRIEIINFIMEKGEASVREISENTGKSQSLISHHLACLRNCGVLKIEKRGKYSIYSINGDRVKEIVKLSLEHIRDNSSAILACNVVSPNKKLRLNT